MNEIKYSQYGLINKGLMELNEQGIMNRMLNILISDKRLTFQIYVPNDFFFRAEVLCDDIVQMCEKNRGYSQSDLAEHVFLDFIDEVRKHDGNVGSILTRLNVRKQELPMVNDNPLVPTHSRTPVTVKVEKADILRAEVLLADLAQFEPNHGLSVEKLIEIVYLDFMLEYKKGRRKNVMKQILEFID